VKRRNPETPSMDMGGVKVESPNVMQASLEELQDLVRFQDEGLNVARINRWMQLVANAEERGIQLTFVPYRKTMLRVGQEMPEDLYVVVEVPGFQWIAKKFASHTPRPNVFYYPGPPVVRGGQAPQGNLSGVVSVCLVAPPLETMTVQLAVAAGTGEYTDEDVKPSSSVEQDFWDTALNEIEAILPQIDPLGERQLAGVRIQQRRVEVGGPLTSPYSGEIRAVQTLGGAKFISVSTAAVPIPVSLYQAVFDAAKVYRKALINDLVDADRDPATDRGLEEFNESIQNLERKAAYISRQPTSAAKSIESIGFNADAALTHINILNALKDRLFRERQKTRDTSMVRNISATIDNLSAQMDGPREALAEIPTPLRSPSNEERARGYALLVPTRTPQGKYEYSRSKRELQRIEVLPVPANHDVAVEPGQAIRLGDALTRPLEVEQRSIVQTETVLGDSALIPRRVGVKTVTPAKAQITLFFQPRPVTNEALVARQSRMFPVPPRRSFDAEMEAVTTEIEEALDAGSRPEWFDAEVNRLGREFTNDEGQAIMKRRVLQNIAFDQLMAFIQPLNAWIERYYRPFEEAANDAFMASGDEPIMSEEEFGLRYFSAQGSEYPSVTALPDLVEKGKKEAQSPRIREAARKALMKPTQRNPDPAEPSEDQITAKAEKMTAPRPTAQPVFYYLVTFFDSGNNIVWEGKVPLETIPLIEEIVGEYKLKGRGKSHGPLDPEDPQTMAYLPAARRSGLNASERRAVAAMARFAPYVPEPRGREEEKRGELIGTIMAQERVARRQAGKEEGPIGRLGIVYGRDMKLSTAEYRPFTEGVAYPSEARQTTGQYSALELREMGVGATAVFQHVPENRFDAYLNYLIPRSIAEKNGSDRPAAIAFALQDQALRDGQNQTRAPEVTGEDAKQKIARLLGKSGQASITSKENPMASRLLNNPRYRQLAEKTGRFMGRNFRRNPDDDDEIAGATGDEPAFEGADEPVEAAATPPARRDDLIRAADKVRPGAGQYLAELFDRPSMVWELESSAAELPGALRPKVMAAIAAFKKTDEYQQAVAERDAAAARVAEATSPPPEAPAPRASATRRRGRKTEAPVEPPPAPAAEEPAGRRSRRRRAAAPPQEPAGAYTTPEAEKTGSRSSRGPSTPSQMLEAAESNLAAALSDASAAYLSLYESLRDPRTGATTLENAKASFEATHASVAAALLARNERFAEVNGPDALMADLGAKHRRMMERATAAFARGPDAVNARLTPKVREDLLIRLATEVGYDGTPLISPDRMLAKRGLEPLHLTSPEEAAAAAEMARRFGGPPVTLSPLRYAASSAPSMDAALIAARGQGAMKRFRPKPTSTVLLQIGGAKGSQNIQPEVYTAPKEVLDRGFDRFEGVPKRSIILWMSPGSDHIIRYTTGPSPVDAGGRADVEMVGQFAVGEGDSWQALLNRALAHSVAWYSDIQKGQGRVAKYDLWFGKSGWPYLYRLFAANSNSPMSVPTLLDRMEKMGLTVTGETEELLKVTEAKSATAKGNILNWIQEQGFDPENPDEKVVEALLEDARSYQSAIDRTRKTRPVADIELGKDLFRVYEEAEMMGQYAAGTEAAFASSGELAPILVVPPKIYDGEGRAVNSERDAETLANCVYQAVREAVQTTGKHDLTIVDGNLFTAARASVIGALSNPDGLKNLSLTGKLGLRERTGTTLTPCPLVAAIQFAGLGEDLQQIFTINVILPDTYRAQAAMLHDLPRAVLGAKLPTMEQEGTTVDLIRVNTIFSGASAGDLNSATANALETALVGRAGAVLIADLPDSPSKNARPGVNIDPYLFFNPPLAGAIAKVVVANFGSISIIKLMGPAAPAHRTSFKELIVDSLNKRLRAEMGAESVAYAAIKPKLSALAKKFRVPPEAFIEAMTQYAGREVRSEDLQSALSAAAWSRLAINTWNTLVIAVEPLDRESDRPMSENPYRRNFNRRGRIDMASRFMRQVPWMWPDR